MPVKFWDDEAGEKYKAAYFTKFKNIWHHGDFVERTSNNGFVVHGRSDSTLNPGGVRIGTAEIYQQVEDIDFITEGLVVGQNIKMMFELFYLLQQKIIKSWMKKKLSLLN